MRVLSERSSCAASAAYLLKIAVCTIPRCGIAAIAFLFLGILALFSACTQYLEYQALQHTPIQLSASVLGDGASIADVLTVDGVHAATPVLRIDAQFTGKSSGWSGQLLAIDGQFLNIPIQEGQVFPARSNMPVLLVNPASGFSCGETIRLFACGQERTALVCGIVNDESPDPAAYMSCMTAASIWPQPQCTEMLLRLSGKHSLRKYPRSFKSTAFLSIQNRLCRTALRPFFGRRAFFSSLVRFFCSAPWSCCGIVRSWNASSIGRSSLRCLQPGTCRSDCFSGSGMQHWHFSVSSLLQHSNCERAHFPEFCQKKPLQYHW